MRSRTTRRGVAVAGVAALALGLTASTATAGPGKAFGKTAAKSCAKERKAMGRTSFAQLYGKPAMPNCIGVTRPQVRQARASASSDCRAERADIGVDAFREKYGTYGKEARNGFRKNAFGKCVSAGVKEELTEERQERVNAARACKAERDELGVPAFRAKYGTNGKEGTNGYQRNAFGKCVSQTAQAEPEPEPEPELEPVPEA